MLQVSIHTLPEAEEAVAELIAREFNQPPCGVTDVETQKTRVSVYLPRKSEVSAARMRALRQGVRRIRQCGLEAGTGRVTVSQVRRVDWAESWKRHFKAMEIGTALLIKPSWSKRRPRKGQPELILDPGLSFGTGQHPTTRFCLEQLVLSRLPEREQSFLDLGTGSGILALAAAKLGYQPIEALDADPDAVRIAQANAQRNGVSQKVHLSCQDLTLLPTSKTFRYDVICANLVADLLMEQTRRIVRWLKPGGILILAGILHTQFSAVRDRYEAEGFKLAGCRHEKEWESGSFKRVS